MNLLLTGAWRDAKSYIPLLEERGYHTAFMQNEADELPCDPAWVEGVVCNGLFLGHDVTEFSSLRFVQLTSAGTDRVPVDHFDEKGIALYNARGVYSIPMAEHAVASVLAFYRNSRVFYENQKKHIWQKDRDLRELYGRTVCIIGCGSVGEECAKRFSAFGCEIIGLDIDCSDREQFEKIYPIDSLLSVVKEADVVIFTLPLTPQTEGMADERFFSALKDGCVIVNISRGGIIRSEALKKALGDRELYAAIDVFEKEPLDPDDPLWSMDSVIITPHNSFVGDGNAARLNTLIMENLANEQRRDQAADR